MNASRYKHKNETGMKWSLFPDLLTLCTNSITYYTTQEQTHTQRYIHMHACTYTQSLAEHIYK